MTDTRLKTVDQVDGDRIVFTDGTELLAYATNIQIGVGVELSPDLEIGMSDKWLDKLVIGDHSRIYAGQIAPRAFTCGDYVTIHEGLWCYGRQSVTIGHNSWFGRRCTIDAEGISWIGNGVGAGQDTHLWSHIRHGDTLQGNRFLEFGEFIAEDDCWFVGRCTSAPVHHERRSMALTESNLVKGMGENTVWGGNPAKDLTDKIGAPFGQPDIVEKRVDFNERMNKFIVANPDVSLWDIESIAATFDVTHRTYEKTNVPFEVRFMRYLLPEAKFVPKGAERVG